MPTYQYACTACDHAFDQVQSFTEPSLTECPECEGRVRKVYNAVGVVFKGSGFYRNDSRSANGSKAPAASGDAAAAGGSAEKSSGSDAGSGSAGASTSAPTAPATKTASTGASSVSTPA